MKTSTALTLVFAIGWMAFPQPGRAVSATFVELKGLGRMNGINNFNQIVGHTIGGDDIKGQLIINGTVTPISVPGSFQTFPYGIANDGRIVGSYDDKLGTHGFIYFKAKSRDWTIPTRKEPLREPSTISNESWDISEIPALVFGMASFTTVAVLPSLLSRTQ